MLRTVGRYGNAVASWNGMGIRVAFRDALPAPDWAVATCARVLVALMDLRDWRTWLADAWVLLDAAEQTRVQRRRIATDRDALTVAYALHRLLLGAVLGRDATEIPLGRDARGCPRLADAAAQTSLSHADGYVALAVSMNGAIGVDIEPATRARVMPEIAERVCHPVEAAALAGLPQPAYGAALLALWVRKEALLKAAGVGPAREMSGFAAPDTSALSLAAPWGETTCVRMLDVGPDCVAAVAAPAGVAVVCAWLRPCARKAGEFADRTEAA